MRHSRGIAGITAVAVLSCLAGLALSRNSLGQEAAVGGARELLAHAQDLALTAEQQAQLEERAGASDATLATWDAENKDATANLAQQIEDAKSALAALQAQRRKLIADDEAAAAALLTDGQKKALDVRRLQAAVVEQLTGVPLTDEQLERITEFCRQTLKYSPLLAGTGVSVDPAACRDVMEVVQQHVLTRTQRQRLEAAGRR